MANDWDSKIKGFLKKTGEDFRRAGNDIKSEAQKLMKEVQDPEGQAKIKEGLKEFGGWARKTAVEVAELAETGFKKAEASFRQAGENWKAPQGSGTRQEEVEGEAPPSPAPSATPPSAPPEMENPPEPATPKKTIGKKKAGGGSSKPKAGAKKTMGKKPPT